MIDSYFGECDDIMAKLFYGSFEKVLRTYITPEITQKDLANNLLLSPKISAEKNDTERQEARDSEPLIDDARISKICKGTRKIPQSILDDHLTSNAFENVEYCFLTEIVPRIPIMKRPLLINDIVLLAEQDDEISAEEKTYYREIAYKKALNTFLTEIYMFAVTGISEVMRANSKPKTTNLPIQNRFFCGREALLSEMAKRYQNGIHLQGIFGMGGVGKTQLALQYAYTYLKEYKIIWWINAENKLTLPNSVSDFLRLQGYSLEDRDTDKIRKNFIDYFAAHENWLLIYDNAEYGTPDEYETLASFMPMGAVKGDILLTTRYKNAFEDAFHVELTVFGKEEAVYFLQNRTHIDDIQNASILAEQMGFLPLALEYAAAYIRETPGVDYIAYSKKLEKFGIRVLDLKVGHQMYKRTVREAFHITLDRLLADSSSNYISMGAGQFLNLCAFLASDGIDLKIFAYYGGGLPEPIRSVLGDELDRDELVRVLTKYSLVHAEWETLSIHRLLQEILRDELSINDATLCINYAYGVFYKMFYSMQKMPVKEIRPLLTTSVPHVQAVLLKYVQCYQCEGQEIADSIMVAKEYFSWTAILLTDWKKLDEAGQMEGCRRDIPILQTAIQFYDMMPGNKTIYWAYTLMLLAQSNAKLGDEVVASGEYFRALQIVDEVIKELPVDIGIYPSSNKVQQLYRAEAFQLASDICAAVGSCNLIYNHTELLWKNYKSLVNILLKQFARFPYKADAHNYRETWLNLWIFSQQIADYTKRAFVVRLIAPREWMDERQYPFLDGTFGFFFPAENTEYKSADDVIDGFDLLLSDNRVVEIAGQTDGDWTTLVFAENVETPEEMLTALLKAEKHLEESPLKHLLRSAIFLLAEKLEYGSISIQYADKLSLLS